MKRLILQLVAFFLLLPVLLHANEISIDSIFNSLNNELKLINQKYESSRGRFQERNVIIKSILKKSGLDISNKTDLLIELQIMDDSILFLNNQFESDISKIRYKKGIEIIKLLNEKMLSLDHHFSTIRTFNEISNIANPNNYPEFQKLKDVLKKQNDKKSTFSLPALLDNNIYVSLISSFVSLFNGGKDHVDKEKQLEDVSCIVDFTLRMNQDLNTIFYETAFLQSANTKITNDLDLLFKEYIKVLDINQSLKECRDGDDWDKIYDALDKYIQTLGAERLKSPNSVKASKMQVNLEFSIDRLLQFISGYNGFINQCVQYYNKFKVVLENYENEKRCDNKLPMEFKKLKDDVNISIQKFNTAYSTVEINGSKMKELLYGLPDN